MNKKNIANVVMKLYLYADVCKMIHYSAKKMHEHKQADAARDCIMKFADSLAEQAFGFTGRPSFTDFSLRVSIKKAKDLSQVCQNVFDLISNLSNSLKKNDKYSGIVSLIDDFKGQLANCVYLNLFDNVSQKTLNEAIDNELSNFFNEYYTTHKSHRDTQEEYQDPLFRAKIEGGNLTRQIGGQSPKVKSVNGEVFYGRLYSKKHSSKKTIDGKFYVKVECFTNNPNFVYGFVDFKDLALLLINKGILMMSKRDLNTLSPDYLIKVFKDNPIFAKVSTINDGRDPVITDIIDVYETREEAYQDLMNTMNKK